MAAIYYTNKYLKIILYSCLIFGFLLYLEDCQNNIVQKRWNNGICQCGNKLKFANSTVVIGLNCYYFKCDNCNNTVIFRNKLPNNYKH